MGQLPYTIRFVPEGLAWEQLRTRFAGCFSRLILSGMDSYCASGFLAGRPLGGTSRTD
jgi:hypothetical protein